ncbi:MAG: L-threonylcarbamoyladenylate synthase [Deinococcota bacterium]
MTLEAHHIHHQKDKPSATPTDIERAVELLAAGKLVAFPTETVYGLGADASNVNAVTQIFAVKGRPANHPVIVHLASPDQLAGWASSLSPEAKNLVDAFMPGPLTMIVNRQSHVLDAVTGGQDSVGLRVPNHPVAQKLLEIFGGGVAAPSANRFGHISPTTAAHVRAEFAGDARVTQILAGGPCEVGLESTIVDVRGGRIRLLRPGGITLEQLREVLGYEPEQARKNIPRASGMLERHYAPTTPTQLLDADELDDLLSTSTKSFAVISRRACPPQFEGKHTWRQLADDPQQYGRQLYAILRELDTLGQAGEVEGILLEQVPDTPAWLAVRDRLTRASA